MFLETFSFFLCFFLSSQRSNEQGYSQGSAKGQKKELQGYILFRGMKRLCKVRVTCVERFSCSVTA